ncbi:hypothetical protein ACFO25_03685 [Paenactinomyces guangxiensis]|uniref:Uncharacterized protein n=1 Tax=Paenactinomyces guangxiensis TaxID=1490290 RepID=A0A7W2A966_9BACL|nr:hypothetical protein [Paenactinomyces guangxiensis]MBA4494867.1 hypothetical protein [Paenactinomyces guangxiensis]MBH8591950.1 hypothetical protein [Paenactinomyces guangxiensis]
MKICEVIPSLKLLNFNVENVEPERMTKDQLHIVFQIIGNVLESNSPATREEKEEFERYQNSYLRKRIVRCWQRKKIRFPFQYDAGTCRDIFEEIKPMLIRYFKEEYKGKEFRINPLTFRAFLWNQEYLSKKFNQIPDCRCWGEILKVADQLKEKQMLNLQSD